MGSAVDSTQFISLKLNCTAEPKVDCGADLLVEKGPNDWKRAQVRKSSMMTTSLNTTSVTAQI